VFEGVASDFADGEHKVFAPGDGQPSAGSMTADDLAQFGQLGRVVKDVGGVRLAQLARWRQRVISEELVGREVIRVGGGCAVEQARVGVADGGGGSRVVGVGADQREGALGQSLGDERIDVHPQRCAMWVVVVQLGSGDDRGGPVGTGVCDPAQVMTQHPAGMTVKPAHVGGV
jgi:hypothetical protein